MYDKPQDYEDWKKYAIERQGQYLHMRNKFDQYKAPMKPAPQQVPNWQKFRNHPNAMDTSADRARARGRLAHAEEAIAQSKYNMPPPRPPFAPREGFLRRRQPPDLRDVTCYNCQKKGHLSRNCPQPRQPRQTRPQYSNTRGLEVVDDRTEAGDDLQIAQMIADNRTTQQRKDDWLRMAANETEEFKELVTQELMGGKDFGDA
jgi:hypothetical protein